ncbi:MAG: M23 family metallopeptidase [Halioglobus sp.]|nr:M23 family metallopeptidase [Halioglobus sp.]
MQSSPKAPARLEGLTGQAEATVRSIAVKESKSNDNRYATGRVKFWGETVGLHPFKLRMQQAKIAIRGEENVPASQYDLSSLRQLRPDLAFPLWRGKQKVENKVIISNLFNHTPTPIDQGWSVKVTQTKDFRGRDLTYDSHNGTDYAVPIGTTLLAAAPGKVIKVISEFNRGGLKIYIDHGQGLITCCAHLARATVREGDIVMRAQPIAITGYSGLDGLITFPFGIPHTHCNVWLNGVPVDPFPYNDENGRHISLYRAGELPLPYKPERGSTTDDEFAQSSFNSEAVKQVLDACLTKTTRDKLNAYADLYQRANHTICEQNYYPTRFPVNGNMYDREYPRRPILDLPFYPHVFDGIVFSDDI